MSNNYYADFTLAGSLSGGVTYRIHIGKASWRGDEIGYGFSTISGRHFPDVESWVKFLRHNIESVRIYDESGEEHDVEEFVQSLLLNPNDTSKYQIDWLKSNISNPLYGGGALKIWDEPQTEPWRPSYWIDKATGKLFYNGEFS